MSNSWILIETFGDEEPSVIGVGSSPKSFVSPRNVLRSSGSRNEALTAVAEALSTGAVVDRLCKDRYRRVLAEPLRTFAGRTHGVWVWLGQRDETPPRRDAAGAWQFNLTKSTASGSGDLLDLYRVPQDERETQRALAGAFTRLVTNRDESEAMAKIVQSAPGTTHQAVWTVRRDDGELRAAHFSCRMIAEDGVSGTEVILRGITHDIGPAGDMAGTVRAIFEGQIIPLRQRAPDVPPRVAEVIERALAKEPVNRWQSAAAMRNALLHAS